MYMSMCIILMSYAWPWLIMAVMCNSKIPDLWQCIPRPSPSLPPSPPKKTGKENDPVKIFSLFYWYVIDVPNGSWTDNLTLTLLLQEESVIQTRAHWPIKILSHWIISTIPRHFMLLCYSIIQDNVGLQILNISRNFVNQGKNAK